MEINRHEILGHVGRDGMMKQAKNGTYFMIFSVATRDPKKPGSKDDKTGTSTWHNCIVWGKLAESMADEVKKGRKVWVVGRVVNSSYQRDGRVIETRQINVDNMLVSDFRNTPIKATEIAEKARQAEQEYPFDEYDEDTEGMG